MTGEEVYCSVVVDETDFVVFLIKDDGLVVEEEVSQYHKIYVRVNQHVYPKYALLVVVAAQNVGIWGDIE